MTNVPRAFARWFAPLVAGCCAVIGLCGFVVVTAGQNRAHAARVASSTTWASPSGTSTASATAAPHVAPPSSTSILVRARCPHVTAVPTVDGQGDVNGTGANCDWSPTVLLSADAFVSTAYRDAFAAQELSFEGGPGQVLVGPDWVVQAFIGTTTGIFATPAQIRATLTAVARRIGGTIRTA